MIFKSTAKPIAIIGMAGLFPQAHNATEYWKNIINQVNCITDVPSDRWSIDEYYDADPQTPDKTYSKRGGFLPEIDFNPLEFGLPPNLLHSTDTSQILSLIVAQNALQDAGYGTAKPSIRQRTGVVLGACMGQKLTHPLTKRLEYPVWEKVLKSHHLDDAVTQKIIEQIKLAYGEWDENTFPGLLGNVIAGRIANRLDLGGMNCVVDAACASSLSALQMAISELREHRSDMMITGGVDTDNSLFAYMCFSKTPALSKQEQIKPFDAQADGMLLGEGIGMVVLKRLEDAERDGDRIYAVIKGLGASSDGKYKSIYAPRSSGQALALKRAYEDAGFAPATVGLVEAHGTGTKAGDPAEIKGLMQVFQENNPNQQYIALGSVKSQIGHTKAAAGAASLIKAALALHHKILPPTINVTQPHPQLENSPFYVNTQAKPWLQGVNDAPRRAGVSSFGFGGSNYHAVLEEYQGEHEQNYRVHPTPESILIHAPNPQALLIKCQHIETQWKSEQGALSYQKIVYNCASVRIPLSGARVGFVAASLKEALTLLTTAITNLARLPDQPWEHPQGIYYRPIGVKGKVVALFSGQGSQYVGMGNTLAMNFPELRQAYSHVDKLLQQDELPSISSVVFPATAFTQEEEKAQTANLRQTANAQPAIGAFSFGLYKILQQGGFYPDFTAGHSFGELTALWAGGVLNDADYFYLAQARGKAMSETLALQGDSGKMLAVQGDTKSITQAIADFSGVTVANYNSPQQIVLAGNSEEIDQVKQFLEQSNYHVTLLPVAAAFHTALVSQAQNQFAQAINKVKFQSPQVPVYANSTANTYPETIPEIEQNLMAQMVNPVKFQEKIEQIYQAGGSIFVEFGPRSILTHLVNDILIDKPHVAVALNSSRNKDSDRQFREAIVKLRVTGLKLTSCDRYKLKHPANPEKTTKGFTVKVTGCNYGTEQRKANFLAALEEQNKIPDSTPSLQEDSSAKISQERIVTSITQSSLAAKSDMNTHQKQPSNGKTKPTTQFATNGEDNSAVTPQEKPIEEGNSSSLGSLERTLMQFQEHQADINKIQQQYLQNQAEYTQQFLQLVREKYDIDNSSSVMTPNSPSRPKSPTPQVAPSPQLPKSPQVPNSQVAPSPQVSSTPNIDLELLELLTQSLLAIVSDKTGYPVEMLELEMDMEADLGIDSIKRVEILGAMQESFPELPPVNPEELAELRTLAQIADYMGNRESQEMVATAESVSATPKLANPNKTGSSSVTNNTQELRQSLLDLISTQTGYATEGIELDMDLETDLGIDENTKKEFLTAIASLYPSLVNNQDNQAEILELRTPAQIIEYLGSKKNSLAYP